MPQPSGLSPIVIGVPLAKFIAQAAGRLTQNLEVMQHPDLKHLVALEYFTSRCRLFENALNRRESVDEALTIVSHSGTASRSAVSLAPGRSIDSVATSTRACSSS